MHDIACVLKRLELYILEYSSTLLEYRGAGGHQRHVDVHVGGGRPRPTPHAKVRARRRTRKLRTTHRFKNKIHSLYVLCYET